MKKISTSPYMPTEVEIEQVSETEAKVSAFPFESGYAITLAHPLRRLLMSSSVGFSPVAVKIDGASHEFDSIRGMLEDVAVFIINLKNIRFRLKSDADEETIDYTFSGHKEIKGCDLENDSVEIVTPELHLASINDDAELKFSIIVKKGIGYVPSEELRDSIPDGYIPLDAFLTPVKRAVYNIEKMLVEDDPNYEKIVFDITTDGQIDPVDAFKNAISVMYKQMSVFNKVLDISTDTVAEKEDDGIDLKPLLVKIDELNLSARSFNSLDRAGIKYLGEVVLMSEVELKNIKNLGKRSCEEISVKLDELGYPVNEDLESEVKKALLDKLETLKS
jgi:DNA-directed RNA polymerase subunit alpha